MVLVLHYSSVGQKRKFLHVPSPSISKYTSAAGISFLITSTNSLSDLTWALLDAGTTTLSTISEISLL
ncbi:hypothetical protein ACHAXN_010102 [Cyclotella atomus]